MKYFVNRYFLANKCWFKTNTYHTSYVSSLGLMYLRVSQDFIDVNKRV